MGLGHTTRDGVTLAYRHLAGRAPTTVFLPGYRSDMAGAKALETEAFCRRHGLACLRLDYAGHGESGGRFEDGTIGGWRDDALHVIETVVQGDLVLVGSSMGGWLALLIGLMRPERLVGLIGLAAAPDFTETLMWAAMTPGEREVLQDKGVLLTPSAYGEAVPITRGLIEEGREHLLMGGPIDLAGPIRLIQGQRDPDVPWQTAIRLAERLMAEDVEVVLVKEGDYRLSRPGDLALLRRVLASLLLEDGA